MAKKPQKPLHPKALAKAEAEAKAAQDLAYVKFLGDNIKRTVAQTRSQLEALRPNFNLGNWKNVPGQLKDMNNLFARMDIILREVEKQVAPKTSTSDKVTT